ncbi:hypothetical protein IGL98_002482 [Enterococcus sp. DIV0840]|uniref:DUF3130 domain-containing protein n=1 Tax=Enterococcus TaxID=1350 RepID=UPI001A8D2B6C|nr:MULTISPECIES: DUF3130 domain-containing protein [Enterococcus]MBO0434023.1 DUF3130 domain-containing protein [Enterococcus sp. DIV0849a]MBO0472849.1 DUF3130 domain-containing protein [Enterococcus ureasiticus]
MTKISTDQGVVSDITNKFTSSLSDVSFSSKKSFSFSQSSAASGLKSSLSSLSSSISNFESYASSDVGKLNTIHQAIEIAERGKG